MTEPLRPTAAEIIRREAVRVASLTGKTSLLLREGEPPLVVSEEHPLVARLLKSADRVALHVTDGWSEAGYHFEPVYRMEVYILGRLLVMAFRPDLWMRA